MLAYLVREHNKTSRTRKIRNEKTKKADRSSEDCDAKSGKEVCKNMRAEEEQIIATRAKQHEDKEEDTGIRPKKTKTKTKTNDRSSE